VFQIGTRMPTISRTEGQYLVPLKIFIKNKASKWWCLICGVCKFHFSIYYNNILHLEKSIVAKGGKFSLYTLKFIRVSNCNRVTCKRSILQFWSDQSKTKHQSMVEKDNVIVWINPNNFIACKKENQHDNENEVYSQFIEGL
jgi:hypothetical protein